MHSKPVYLIAVAEGRVFFASPDTPEDWYEAKGATLNPTAAITMRSKAWGEVITDGTNHIFFDPDTLTTIAIKTQEATDAQ